MPYKIVKAEQTGNRQVDQLQATLAAATAQLRQGPMGDGVQQDGVVIPNNVSTQVNTLLGRTPRGWVVCRLQNSTLGGCITEIDSDDQSFTFLSKGDSTVSFWFF